MFKKVLIANRGEIALRVIRACRELGLESVAVHSTADTDALHVKFADEAVCIGPPPSQQSYLNVPMIISAAEVTGADAIHPGYGFLSENADFAEVCKKCKLTWIGPPPDAMRLMGDKIRARAAMAKAGVPMLPGIVGHPRRDHAARGRRADRLPGHPQGERRRRWPRHEDRLREGEAPRGVGDGPHRGAGRVRQSRDVHGAVLPEAAPHRDPGRRRQARQLHAPRRARVLDPAPPPEGDRGGAERGAARGDAPEDAAGARCKAIEAIGYTNVGTIEFLLDTDGSFYFMEMNTRLQVEHPVTELVHRRRSRARADPDRGRRAAVAR